MPFADEPGMAARAAIVDARHEPLGWRIRPDLARVRGSKGTRHRPACRRWRLLRIVDGPAGEGAQPGTRRGAGWKVACSRMPRRVATAVSWRPPSATARSMASSAGPMSTPPCTGFGLDNLRVSRRRSTATGSTGDYRRARASSMWRAGTGRSFDARSIDGRVRHRASGLMRTIQG